MIHYIWRVDVAQSLATYTFHNGSSWVTENRPLSVYPELLNAVLANSAMDPVVSNSPSDAIYGTGLPVMAPPPDGTSFLPPDQAFRVTLPTHREVIPNFTARKRAGEILVSDYDVGYIDVVSHASRSETPSGSPVMHGNYVCDKAYFGKRINPLNLPQPSVPVNGRLTAVDYMLAYRRYAYDTKVMNAVPMPTHDDLCNWNLFPTVPDNGVVTSAAASAVSGAWDMLTELAEFPETLKFVSDHTRRIGQTTIEYAQDAHKLGSLRHAGDVLAKHWLQYRYAIMPLFHSLKDVRTVLKDMIRVYAEFKARSEIDTACPFVPAGYYEVNNPTATHRCFIKNAYTPDQMLSSLASLVGFNPVATAWELTPLSFVADWFVNISDWIIAQTSLHLEDYSRSVYSVKYDQEWNIVDNPDNPKCSLTLNPKVYRRIVINPSSHFGLKIGLEATWKRTLDGAALSLQPMNRIIRNYR